MITPCIYCEFVPLISSQLRLFDGGQDYYIKCVTPGCYSGLMHKSFKSRVHAIMAWNIKMEEEFKWLQKRKLRVTELTNAKDVD